MLDLKKYIIHQSSSLSEAFIKLDNLPETLTLFVIDDSERLVGTLTDGDIRRGFIKGINTLDSRVECFMNREFYFLSNSGDNLPLIRKIKQLKIKVVPLLDDQHRIIKLYDFTHLNSILPVDAVLMAGGRGERMRPLTDKMPKPLLPVGDKPILEHNIDRMITFGIENFHITIKYLGDQIVDYFGSGEKKGVRINYISEKEPLGTIGSLSLIKEFASDSIIVMNSDLFTSIDFADFYQNFIDENADAAIATIPYNVDVPYAILNVDDIRVTSLSEKPTYSLHANAGIYLFKKELVKHVPYNQYLNATDFVTALIEKGLKIIRYPIIGYWVDIGKHEDYRKVQEFAKHLKIS